VKMKAWFHRKSTKKPPANKKNSKYTDCTGCYAWLVTEHGCVLCGTQSDCRGGCEKIAKQFGEPHQLRRWWRSSIVADSAARHIIWRRRRGPFMAGGRIRRIRGLLVDRAVRCGHCGIESEAGALLHLPICQLSAELNSLNFKK